MKKCILILLVILLSCYGCSAPNDSYNNNYQIVVDENGNWFFEFEDEKSVGEEKIHPDGFVINVPFYTYIVFPSVAAMKTQVTKHQLSANALCTIKDAFQRDAQNNIPIWNFDHLYTPVYPNSISVLSEEVAFYGTSYNVSLETQNNGELIFFIGRADKESDWSEWIPSETPYTETTIEGTNITKFTYGNETQITVYRYMLENDVRRVWIKDVVVETQENGEPSTKKQILFFTECDGISCSGMWNDFSERPSEEILLSLGIEPLTT